MLTEREIAKNLLLNRICYYCKKNIVSATNTIARNVKEGIYTVEEEHCAICNNNNMITCEKWTYYTNWY